MHNVDENHNIEADVERLGPVVSNKSHKIGNDFTAKHFSEDMFGGRMDPLLMVDHFEMTGPTFEPHLHAGISAVTMMFADSQGGFVNRDTLGNNITLQPGDLYWLTAGSGAVHEERPETGARTYALQIFVNLPSVLKKNAASALHVPADSIPILDQSGHRVRVILGQSGNAIGSAVAPEEMTMLDGFVAQDGGFTHRLPEGWNGWIYSVSGKVVIEAGCEVLVLKAGSATTVTAGPAIDIVLKANEPSHFVLIAARPLHETFVKHGPLTMSSVADVRQTLTDYAQGRFGHIPA